MSTVAIVGAGHVAGATAHALAVSDRVGRLLLIDEAASAARGKALDIRQSAAIVPFHTRLDGTDDLSRVTGCECVRHCGSVRIRRRMDAATKDSR